MESLQLLVSGLEFSDAHYIMLSGLAFATTIVPTAELTDDDVLARKQVIAACGAAEVLLKQVSPRRATALDCVTS